MVGRVMTASHPRFVTFAALLALAAAAPAQSELPFAERLAAIVPPAAEREWRDIPWRAQFGKAMLEADAADRPVLLWAMNGHPLGQT